MPIVPMMDPFLQLSRSVRPRWASRCLQLVGECRQSRRRNPPPRPGEQSRANSSDYVVGYGRPPVATRFQPGKSGNPKGRPKAAKSLNTLARELLTGKVPVRTGSGQKKMHRIEAVLHKAFELALKGNPRALSQILNLYAVAVPEAATVNAPAAIEELTTTDVAILEEFKASILQADNQ